jgi:hypothetical protein
VGLAPVQRDGLEYEFSVVLDLEVGGTLTVSKTRCSALEEMKSALRREDVDKIADILLQWLNDGATPAPKPPPSPPKADGAPKSAVEALAVRMNEAQTKAELEALVNDIKKLSLGEQGSLRPLFNKRQTELSRAP